ncbi:Protein cip2a-like protein [Dirofilaria immitis]|nr:Protein cip2a-like protein [Dirofilaria immitis]
MCDALKASIAAAITAAHRFQSDNNQNNASLFGTHLTKLVQLTNTLDSTARLSIHDHQLCELLRYCSLLLNNISTSAAIRSHLHLFLFNLGENLQICGSVFECLKLSLREQLGPQNLIDVLRLLQVLTYERNVVLGIWTNDLISFLLSEVTCDDEPEWLPYCIAILCNLAARSKSACLRIRKSSSYKAFNYKLLKLLAHDSRTVVISSLVLVGFLEEKLRDTVFCFRNIPQTFRCIFNVLILGDHLMTRHIAVDLLKRLIVNDSPDISSAPTITSTGKDLASYSYFENTIQLVAGLFVQIDPRTEESIKVYDLLLLFCSLAQLRSATAQAILRCTSSKEKLTTPIIAICNTSGLSFDEAIQPEIPLKAIRLLIYLIQELMENNGHIQIVLPVEHILRLIETNLKTAIETVSSFVKFQCQRITEGLRLVETILNDDEIKTHLLEVVTAPLCSHIIESQMISNTIVTYVGQPAIQHNGSLPEWCVDGVAVVLKLLKVLIVLKDYSKTHKDLYWKILKDDRLVPFIAYAIADGGIDLTHEALLLYIHCAQSQTFPTKWYNFFEKKEKVENQVLGQALINFKLGDLIANCPREKTMSSNAASNCFSRSCSSEVALNGDIYDFSIDGRKTPSDHSTNKSEITKQIDNLPDKLQQRNDLKDSRGLQLLGVYEKEIQSLKIREKELEGMLAKMEDSLRQNEYLQSLHNNEENEIYFDGSDFSPNSYETASNALIDKDKECVQLTNELKILELKLEAKQAENNGLYFSF